jgi:hypothetical protein
MLFLFIKFLYIIILSFVYGYTLQRFVHTRILNNTSEQPPFPLTALIGLFGITVLASFLSILMPLAALAHGIVLAGAILCYLGQRTSIHGQLSAYITQARTAGRSRQLFTGAAILFVLYISAQRSFTYDEGLYYAQFIKWMQSYKVVPGLANLHERFGFNSQWHVLAATFNGSWLTGTTSNHINGVLYLLTVLCLLPRKEETNFLALFKAGLLLLISMPQFCVYNIVAPAADMPIYYISCLLIVQWLEHSTGASSLLKSPAGAFLLLAPVFLITVKVSAMPVLVFTAILYWQVLRDKQYAQCWKLSGVALVIVLPWLIRNVILTGYILFPVELPNMFHLDWAVPVDVIRLTRQDIHIFAFYRNVDVQRFATESTIQHYISWFTQNTRIYDKLIILLAIAFLPLAMIRRKYLPAGIMPICIFLLLGCAFWLLQAPDPRFGYSYLVPMAVLAGLLCIPKLRIRQLFLPVLGAVLLFQAGTVILNRHLTKVFTADNTIVPSSHTHWWLTPVPYTAATITATDAPSGAHIAANGLCWDSDLPCVPYDPQQLRRRGQRLEEGFVRIVPATHSEAH